MPSRERQEAPYQGTSRTPFAVLDASLSLWDFRYGCDGPPEPPSASGGATGAVIDGPPEAPSSAAAAIEAEVGAYPPASGGPPDVTS